VNETIILRNDRTELEPLRLRLLEFLSRADVTPETIDEVFLIAEELVVNTISYGYQDDDPHEIEVRLALEGRLLRMEIRDDGRAFDPLERVAADLERPVSDRPIGGLGIHLVRSLADVVAYSRCDGQNVVTLEKLV